MKIKYLYIILTAICLISCEQNEPPKNKESVIINDTPEKTVRSWQQFMDNNDFEAAKSIGTKDIIQFLDEFEDYLETMPEDTLKSKSDFISLSCRTKKDHATCIAKIRDLTFQETYLDTFQLTQKDSKWLISSNDSK